MSETTSCPICHSERTRFLFEGWDLMFGHPDSALVYQCRNCRHIFVAGELTPEQLTDMYSNYYPRAQYDDETYEPYKEKGRFLYWLDGEEWHAFRHVPRSPIIPPPQFAHLNRNALRVLDIGCGFCESLGYHQARGCEVYGVEADENAKKIADRYGFNVHIGLFDPSLYEPEFFDYVTMDEVFEHIIHPLKTLREVNSILKPGGMFVANAPNPNSPGRLIFGTRWASLHLPYHRHFYSRKSIDILAQESGFHVHKMKSATISSQLLNLWAFYFCAGKPGQKAQEAVQRCGIHLSADVQKQWHVQFYTFLKKTRLLSLPMRLADLCGIGDWNIIILQKKSPTAPARKNRCC